MAHRTATSACETEEKHSLDSIHSILDHSISSTPNDHGLGLTTSSQHILVNRKNESNNHKDVAKTHELFKIALTYVWGSRATFLGTERIDVMKRRENKSTETWKVFQSILKQQELRKGNNLAVRSRGRVPNLSHKKRRTNKECKKEKDKS